MKKKSAPKIENKRDTYFLSVTRGKSKRPYAIKIGLCSRGKVNQRIANLQTGSVDRLRLMAVVQGAYERKFQRKYAGYRLNKGEFFKPAPDLLRMIATLADLGKLIDQLEHQDTEQLIKGLERQQQLVVAEQR
ncbi:MAG TPA: GIY-YIG nuclease family protein [Verrucomicrobiae bacterium]|nr:GIY-YIG nuclease family protein [Verrucomicrobiae bacterium]